MNELWTPDQSNLNFAVKTEKPQFFGRESLLKKRETPANKTIRGLKMRGRAIPRENYRVLQNGEEIGVVTSGTLSPTLEIGIALAFVPADLPLESAVEIEIRGAAHAAHIVNLPFVPRTTKKSL